MEQIILPKDSKIDTGKLGRLFDNMSESYKLFWFKAIVDSIKDGKLVISFEELINEMIADGWYMVSEYKLNLGPSDTLEKVILKAYDATKLKSSEKKSTILKMLEENDDRELKKMKNTLTLNVPYRLQSPYLEDIKGNDWNKKDLLDRINNHGNLLYYFLDNKTIAVNKRFAEYIKENYEVISGWIRFKMINYLQNRNPSVPGIVYKLDAPTARKLKDIINFWKLIIDRKKVYDIYSHIDMSNEDISIDHFIPWSYVAHDEFWNLSPTTKSINSSKSNNLPKWDKYFDSLCLIQYDAFSISNDDPEIAKQFRKCLDEHLNDKKIRYTLFEKKQNFNEFHNHMYEIVRPVYSAAKELGFNEWQL